MANIEVVETGHIDRSDSAFPTLVKLDNGDLVCGFSTGGGAHANGETHCASSTDGGRTWQHRSVILERTVDPVQTNHLRLSRTADGTLLAYGQRDQNQETAEGRKRIACTATLCRSADHGKTWSAPEVVPFEVPGPYEISNPIVVTSDERWLAPTATFHNGRYGERVVLLESSDNGSTWPHMHTVFQDPGSGIGYLEQKIIEFHPNHLLAIAWVQDYQADTDLKNEYSLSIDGGRSWDGPHPTGIQGQTMTPIWLGKDRFLVLYNKRYGHQTIQMCLVRISGGSWTVEFEGTMFDGHASLELTDNISSQEQIRLIKFGYPGGMRLDDETVLAVHWCEEDGICGIRWTRLRIT